MSYKLFLSSFAAFMALNCFANNELSEVASYKEILDKSYNLINLDMVRQNSPGIDGSNVNVGIMDTSININHPSLRGKNLGVSGVSFETSWNNSGGKNTHGTHVAGIILGKKINNYEPYGVAHNSNFYNFGIIGERNNGFHDVNQAFKNKNIKVINHSWGKSIYPLINTQFDNGYRNLLNNMRSQYPNYWGHKNKIDYELVRWLAGKNTQDLIALSKDDKILNVFAAGNSGIISSSIDSVVPSYDEDIRAWLNVGNLNALNAEKNADGSITLKNDFQISWNTKDRYGRTVRWTGVDGSLTSSQLFVGSTNYSLLAPGYQILAANANYQGRGEQKYVPMTGTSMAAPMVSGAAALVAQKYPFLDGAGIADVLLTTANKNLNLPDVVVKPIDGGRSGYYVVYLNKNIPTDRYGNIIANQIQQDILKTGIPAYTRDQSIAVNKIMARIKNSNGSINRNYVFKLTQEEYAGQGVLDVEKALKGLAILDLNRLNNKDIERFGNENIAFYTIDTKGYNGEFSNDISQQTWLNSRHLGDDVAINKLNIEYRNINKIGLKKQGGGHLILSGKNSYEGPTRTVGGVIQLRGNNYKKASIKGDTYVENQNSGMIISDAIVEKNAFVGNNGILQIENFADIYGKVIAYNGGALNSMKNSTLKTSEVIITQNGILTGAGNIISDVSLNDGIITRADNLNMNKLNVNYGNNNIYSSSINLRSDFNNNYNSSLNIFGDVALNLNAQNTLNNYGKLNIKNRLIIQSNNDFINYQGANLNLDNKESILYTAGNFVNKGRLSFTGQRADELGKIMAGKKAFLRETQNLNLNLNNDGINIINNQYRGGLGVEIIRTAQGIDQEINKNLITLNNGASYLLDLSTQKDSNGKSLYFIMKTKNQYTNRNFRNLARSYQNQAYTLSAQNNIAANNNYINSINNINTKTEQTNQAIINRKNENSKQILAKLDDRDINIMDSLLFSNEGNMQDGIVAMLEVALDKEEESNVFKDISSNIKNNKPFSSTQTQAFNIRTKRAVNTNIMLTPTKNSPVKMANNMKKLDGVKLASNGNDVRVLLSAIEEEIYKNSFNISAIGTKNSYSNNDYDFVGGVVNFNKMFESQMVGGYFSYAKANVDQNVDIKSDLFEIGAYIRQYIDSHEIDFTLGYGIGNNKANYNIKYGVDTASYDGKYDSKYFTVGTSYGYKFNLNDGFSFKPFIGFDYFNYTQDSFTASTNHKYVNYNQNFNKAHFKNLQANLGAELIHNNKDITIYARPYIARDIYQSADDLISSFGTANQNFKIDHDNKKRTSFAIDLGVQKEITDNFLIDAGAGTYINNQNRAYNGQLGFTYRF